MDITRLAPLTDADIIRLQKYRSARHELTRGKPCPGNAATRFYIAFIDEIRHRASFIRMEMVNSINKPGIDYYLITPCT